MFLKTAIWRPRQRKWKQKIDLESFQKIRTLMLKDGEYPKFINQYEYLCYRGAYSILHKSIVQTQHFSQLLETVFLESSHGHHPGHRASVNSRNEPAETTKQGKPCHVSPSTRNAVSFCTVKETVWWKRNFLKPMHDDFI